MLYAHARRLIDMRTRNRQPVVTLRTVLVLGTVVLFLFGCEQAKSSTVVTNDAGYQSWVDAVTRVPTPSGELEVTVGECGGLGCYDYAGHLELSPLAGPLVRKVFLHELGHVFDDREMTDADRARFIGITGESELRWWGTAATEFNEDYMAAEWFADVYAICAGAKRIDRRWEYTADSGLLTGRQVQKTCWLIKYAASH